MESKKINGNDLLTLGYSENKSLGVALKINKKRHGLSRVEMLQAYANVLTKPKDFLEDPIFKTLAEVLISIDQAEEEHRIIPLRENIKDFTVYGKEGIEEGAIRQMKTAMKLPISVAGALMPDAHQGYGLPIGGVLATKNAVIPYGVGVDIGCRMALSVYDIAGSSFDLLHDQLQAILIRETKFGAGHGFIGKERSDHAILDHALFREHTFVKALKDKAWSQLGSSGGGNHFVEFGIIDFKEDDVLLNIQKGKYLALLTHSGSRGLGAVIAGHYTQLAKEHCLLPYEAQHLAYLDLNSELGQDYWVAMNLAGDYASACHEIIHNKISKALGSEILTKVENHHNFAWKERINEEEVIVHRKGATPAGKGVMGIIPGSMTAPGFLVRGKGTPEAIHSAAHGAGRQMSRTKAIQTVSNESIQSALTEHQVTLIGAGKDEAPMAYKDIHQVMAAQRDLVDVIAEFQPRIVRMATDGSRED